MPSATACPIPEVDRALSPFVHTNADTLRIRTTLTKALLRNVKDNDLASSHLDQSCPLQPASAIGKSQDASGLRLEYYRAHEANVRAQARQKQLQNSLRDLESQHHLETSSQSDIACDHEAVYSYIALLRRRRRFAELQAIQDCLDRLSDAAPASCQKDPKSLVKDTVGEQPDLPAERLDLGSAPEDSSAPVFKLKKAVLEANTDRDRARSARTIAQRKTNGDASLSQRVQAMEYARNLMVDWVEGELAKLNEESLLLEDASPVKRNPHQNQPLNLTQSEAQIRQSYNRYIKSRSELTDMYRWLLGAAKSSGEGYKSQDDIPESSHEENNGPIQVLANALPHLTRLAHLGSNERDLLQQNVYLQAQISQADDEAKESVARLASESHLIASSTSGVAQWKRAATDAEGATKAFVEQQLDESRREIHEVHAMVDLCSLHSKVVTSA